MHDLIRIIELSKEIGELAEKVLNGNKTPIEKLCLSNRALNSLHRGGIEFVEQLLKMRDCDLLRLRNMGEKTKTEIVERLETFTF
jgi:DNA-directed RNA polymerase alpha subunit